ncbi:MAG: hypothetical protein NC548_38155 [Lachnospiraceae bacterium]|nr:hypothetical protein [Lachnospiraceae bacterium]
MKVSVESELIFAVLLTAPDGLDKEGLMLCFLQEPEFAQIITKPGTHAIDHNFLDMLWPLYLDIKEKLREVKE